MAHLKIEKRQIEKLVNVLESEPVAHGCFGITDLGRTSTSRQQPVATQIYITITYNYLGQNQKCLFAIKAKENTIQATHTEMKNTT